MRGRKNPAANQVPPNLPPCKICGEQGTGFHYGVTACGACKGFFRRSLVRKEPYVCIGSGICVIGPETKRRKSCPKCRHDKCLAVGMSKEAIKTGRYSYVKKSHDIIEMIEHHFQHYVKRKNFGDNKIEEDDNIEHDFEIPQKKIRSSCALEKISEAFRQTGNEFMELSPSKPMQSSQNAFLFDNVQMENGSSLGINQISEMIIPEAVRLGMSDDISTSNDTLCQGQRAILEAKDIFPSSCVNFRSSEFLYYSDSPPSHPHQSTPTPSPSSLSSPISDISNSKESLSPISPPWLDLPMYSDGSYSMNSTEDRNSYLSYPDREYEDEFEPYSEQLRSNKNENFESREAYYTTLTTAHVDHIKQSEVVGPCQPSIVEQLYSSENSTHTPKLYSYNQQHIPPESIELPLLHTPVSNELEQLRRLSWDDINFDDDFLSQGYNNLFIDSSKISHNITSSHSIDQRFYHENNSIIARNENTHSQHFISENMNLNCYWDLDNTTLQIQDGGINSFTAQNNEQLHLTGSTELDPASLDSLHRCASYYRDRQDSDLSTSCISVVDTIHSSMATRAKYSELDHMLDSSDSRETVITNRTIREGQFFECSKGAPAISEITTASSSVCRSLLSKSDFQDAVNVKTAVPLETSKTLSCESEPLNFLNVPQYSDIRSNISTVPKHTLESTLGAFDSSADSNDYSVVRKEMFRKSKVLKTETTDDEILERWTPFSLGGEAPRLLRQEMECEKIVRLQDNNDDYNNKPLPWCEFTEAELDEVVTSLKTSYQKHVVLDTNLLSDQEIAEKLKLFLDILQLREQTFGKCAPMDREAYFKILEATGIDLGGRREWVETVAKIFNRTLQKTVRFFRSVPGFKDICHDDKTILAKSCMYEYIILSCYKGVNSEEQVILDAEHKLALNMDFFRLVFPEMEEHILDIFKVSRKLVNLKLLFEETLILKAISILSPDRDKLKEFEKVDRIYWRLHCCLILSLYRRHASPLQFYARVISVMTDLRELAFNGRQQMCNFRPDMLKLTKDIQVPLYMELMFTQTDSMPEAEIK